MFGLKEPVHFLSSYPIIISTSGHNVIVLLIQFPMYCESIGKQNSTSHQTRISLSLYYVYQFPLNTETLCGKWSNNSIHNDNLLSKHVAFLVGWAK